MSSPALLAQPGAANLGIEAVLAGESRDLRDIPIDERGIDVFRRRVHAATREIRPGTTPTYGQIAQAIGQPDAARDVGAALARTRCRSSSHVIESWRRRVR